MEVLNQNAITIQIVDHPDQLASFDWDSLCQPDHYFTTRNLHALAHAGIDCSYRYFVARQGGQIVGITFGYLTHFPLLGPLKPLVFISGSPANLGFPFAFHMESQKEEIFLQLVHAMLADARKQHTSFLVIRDLYVGLLEISTALVKYPGFYHIPLFQRGWLAIRWRTFEEYLADLQARYRNELLKEMRRINKYGFRFVITSGVEAQPYLADMARQFRYLYLKYQNPSQLFLPESYFRAFSALPECVAFLLFRGEQLATFDLVYERGPLLDVVDSGVDAALVGNFSAHRYLFYEIIRYAISHGFKAVDFGTSNEVKKMRLGCSLQNLSGAIYPLSTIYATMLKLHFDRWLLDDFGFKVPPKNADEETNGWVQPTVFKSAPPSPWCIST